MDDAPWGFAVSHYGRWAHLQGRWGWVPGPVRARAYYAPALVVFLGDANFQITISSGLVGGVAWFPLAPREIYLPSYPVSRGYFENINLSNTAINTTVINNYYYNPNGTNIVYNNRRVPGAIVAVPKSTFIQARPVARESAPVFPDLIADTPVVTAPPVAPTERSVRGAGAGRVQPPARTFERPVVARSAPPATPPGFAAQQPQLTAKPGKPLDDAARRELKPAMVMPAPAVRVVPPTREATRTLRPQTANEPGSAQPKTVAPPPRQPPASKAGRRAEEPSPASSPPGGKKRSKQELEEEARKGRQ